MAPPAERTAGHDKCSSGKLIAELNLLTGRPGATKIRWNEDCREAKPGAAGLRPVVGDRTVNLYAVVMVAVMALITAVTLPALLTMKCPQCNKRCSVDAKRCRRCGHTFPEDKVEN